MRLRKCVQCALAEIFKNAKTGIFMFSLGLIVFNVIRLCYCLCYVSPVIKLGRAAAYWLFLTIANLLDFFFACTRHLYTQNYKYAHLTLTPIYKKTNNPTPPQPENAQGWGIFLNFTPKQPFLIQNCRRRRSSRGSSRNTRAKLSR